MIDGVTARGRPPVLRLQLERAFAAPPERLFAAFTDPEHLRHWWGPDGFTIPSLHLEAREGADYRITMQPPEGDAFHLRGTFRVVDPPHRLVYTFSWEEPDPDDQETLVTLTFDRIDDGTCLVLDQEPFKTAARRELHHDGWTETLERLALRLG